MKQTTLLRAPQCLDGELQESRFERLQPPNGFSSLNGSTDDQITLEWDLFFYFFFFAGFELLLRREGKAAAFGWSSVE